MPGPKMDGAAVGLGLSRGDIQSLILTVGCLRAFHTNSVGINAQEAAGCPNLGLRCVFRVGIGDPGLACRYPLCMDVGCHHPAAASLFSHLQMKS